MTRTPSPRPSTKQLRVSLLNAILKETEYHVVISRPALTDQILNTEFSFNLNEFSCWLQLLSLVLNVIYRRPTSKQLVKMVNTVKAKAAHVLTSQQQVREQHPTQSICLSSLFKNNGDCHFLITQ